MILLPSCKHILKFQKSFLRHFTTTTTSGSTSMNDAINKLNLQELILSNTKISRNHLTPEIKLHLITPECKIFHEPYVENNECKIFRNDPFWGFYWPGGQALTRYILDHPEIVKFKNVLDVGCGSGACSIAAMLSGATYAVANDIDEMSTVAAVINARLNNVAINTCNDNLIGYNDIQEDIILLGDIFYDTEIADILFPWLITLKQKGKMILIGDPGRHGLNENKMKFLSKLKSYELPENICLENNGFKIANVWSFI